MTTEHDIICIECPMGCRMKLRISDEGEVIEVVNSQCKGGKKYAIAEFKSPLRILTTTLLTQSASQALLPVRSDKGIPKILLKDCIMALGDVRVSPPIQLGDVGVSNFSNTGADLIATDELRAR